MVIIIFLKIFFVTILHKFNVEIQGLFGSKFLYSLKEKGDRCGQRYIFNNKLQTLHYFWALSPSTLRHLSYQDIRFSMPAS